MPHVKLEQVGVEFPVFHAASRSVKNRLVQVATGGRIDDNDGRQLVVRSLEKINVEIAEGERVGLIGHNGAGKTTLLRVLSGIYEPTSGHARIDGRTVSLINIGLGIDPEATGRQNIRLRAALMGMSRSEFEDCYEEVAAFTELGEFLDMPFRTYSSGMQLRLAFSISTAINPEILIMDEWLSTGDESFRSKANERLQKVVETTKILVIASHSRHLLEENCTRILWLEHGTVKMDGEPGKVLNAYYRT